MTRQTDIRIGIIGGTGIEDALGPGIDPSAVDTVEPDTPFGPTSAPLTLGTYAGTPIAMLKRHGDGHTIPPAHVPYRANIYALKSVGCTHIVATGATGSLREDMRPADLVICDQLIDRTTASGNRARSFFEHAAVHVEFADPFCPVLRRWLLSAADRVDGATVHERGTYICMEGPSFSTRAESHMYRALGADVVGMTALPEARLAREAELAYALIALPTDYDAWRPVAPGATQQSLLEEIIGNLSRATEASIALLAAALADTAPLHAEASPAHRALDLAIWTRPDAIDPAEIERLRVIWGRRLSQKAADEN